MLKRFAPKAIESLGDNGKPDGIGGVQRDAPLLISHSRQIESPAMLSRNRTALLFAAFGALVTVAVFGFMGSGELPGAAIPMIVFSIIAAGLMGWLLAHKLATPFRAFAILTGAVVMLASQIPFALMTATYFWFQEPVSAAAYGKSIALLIMGGWAIAGIVQSIAGAAAGWLIHWMGAGQLDEFEADAEE